MLQSAEGVLITHSSGGGVLGAHAPHIGSLLPHMPDVSLRARLSTTTRCGLIAGKSECNRCGGPSGRFCRACLLVRYGDPLSVVRARMARGAWLCPHCYEDDHPEEVPHPPPPLPSHIFSPVLAMMLNMCAFCPQC